MYTDRAGNTNALVHSIQDLYAQHHAFPKSGAFRYSNSNQHANLYGQPLNTAHEHFGADLHGHSDQELHANANQHADEYACADSYLVAHGNVDEHANGEFDPYAYAN